MWDDEKRKRFNALRKPGRRLDAADQAELAALVKELEEMEAAYLKPATQRLRHENDRLEKRNRELQDLIKRKEALVTRLEAILAEAKAEEHAIESELASALADHKKSRRG